MAYVRYGKNILRHITSIREPRILLGPENVLHHPLLHAGQGVRYRKLDVILTTTIDKLGKAGETVKVAPGYFRNYLMPKLLAVPSIDKYIYLIREQRKIYQPKEDEEVKVVAKKVTTSADNMSEHATAARRLENAVLTLRKDIKVGEVKELRSPVTKEELIAEVARQLHVQISGDNIHLPSPLTTVGEHALSLRFPKAIPLFDGKLQWTLNVKIRRKTLKVKVKRNIIPKPKSAVAAPPAPVETQM
ncbi:50S ribosomal protein L9 [Impatiens glandulifera]|uniref:50S ribosomal protein L9 n=1 Tax=Impatiens glandulifera TaxID=253017 RepID=UPI001FB0B723|nr:50S ribosomal protein L9 [Impatiens glandulifera]XP_047327109.1 50S ribosomal protein L9 [Impatiens glandulifera]